MLPGFAAFSGPGAEIQTRPSCYLLEGKARGGEVTLGARFLFSQFCPLPGLPPWWPSAPGCKLLDHCVQLSASVSLLTCQGIFLASYYPASIWYRNVIYLINSHSYSVSKMRTLGSVENIFPESCTSALYLEGNDLQFLLLAPWGHQNVQFLLYWSRVQPRGGPQEGICDGVLDSGCPGNIRKMYIGCPHPHKPELGERTQGTGPFRAVLYNNSCAANLGHGHLTYL